jgi:hypothetical protein
MKTKLYYQISTFKNLVFGKPDFERKMKLNFCLGGDGKTRLVFTNQLTNFSLSLLLAGDALS